jgi:hypothetical protein
MVCYSINSFFSIEVHNLTCAIGWGDLHQLAPGEPVSNRKQVRFGIGKKEKGIS